MNLSTKAHLLNLSHYSDTLRASVKPLQGTIPVGSGDIRKELKADSLRVFIREIHNGKTPENAARLAVENSQVWIDKWNSKREYQVQIWRDHLKDYFFNEANLIEILESKKEG